MSESIDIIKNVGFDSLEVKLTRDVIFTIDNNDYKDLRELLNLTSFLISRKNADNDIITEHDLSLPIFNLNHLIDILAKDKNGDISHYNVILFLKYLEEQEMLASIEDYISELLNMTSNDTTILFEPNSDNSLFTSIVESYDREMDDVDSLFNNYSNLDMNDIISYQLETIPNIIEYPAVLNRKLLIEYTKYLVNIDNSDNNSLLIQLSNFIDNNNLFIDILKHLKFDDMKIIRILNDSDSNSNVFNHFGKICNIGDYMMWVNESELLQDNLDNRELLDMIGLLSYSDVIKKTESNILNINTLKEVKLLAYQSKLIANIRIVDNQFKILSYAEDFTENLKNFIHFDLNDYKLFEYESNFIFDLYSYSNKLIDGNFSDYKTMLSKVITKEDIDKSDKKLEFNILSTMKSNNRDLNLTLKSNEDLKDDYIEIIDIVSQKAIITMARDIKLERDQTPTL